jgi:hypothetical protein
MPIIEEKPKGLGLEHNNIKEASRIPLFESSTLLHGSNVIWSSIQKLVDFTLNTKYTKNPHENVFKTQQNLGMY